jgi:hypothetical protein
MRRRRSYPALIALVLLLVGQLDGFVHHAGTRHVTCNEHGETLEAATLVEPLHACDQDHLIGVEGADGGEHEDCPLARALQQVAQTSRFVVAPSLVPLVTRSDVIVARELPRSTAVYLIAPKTSPPDHALSFTA